MKTGKYGAEAEAKGVLGELLLLLRVGLLAIGESDGGEALLLDLLALQGAHLLEEVEEIRGEGEKKVQEDAVLGVQK